MVSIRIAIAVTAFFTGVNPTYARSAAAAATKSRASIATENSPTPAIKSDPPKKWLEVCNKIAPATSILCSLAPLPTIFEVARTKSVGDLPLLPYSSMAANGFIWSLYGWLTDSPAVKWANIMGALLGSYYFVQFKKYSPAGASGLPGTMKQHMIVVAWTVLANTFLLSNFSRKTAADIIGKEGTLIYIILFASPLVAAQQVIATKNAASIPLPFTIASTINCSLWSVVGLLLMNDVYIYFPSIMGLLCALAQLFLKGMYNDSNVETAAAAAAAQEMNTIVGNMM